jgi:hypothetical protein
MAGCTTSNYYITLEPDITDVHHDFFIAKMRGNFKASCYQIFTKGANPQKSESSQKIRTIEATIVFHAQKVLQEPRSFDVYSLVKNSKYSDLKGYQKGE